MPESSFREPCLQETSARKLTLRDACKSARPSVTGPAAADWAGLVRPSDGDVGPEPGHGNRPGSSGQGTGSRGATSFASSVLNTRARMSASPLTIEPAEQLAMPRRQGIPQRAIERECFWRRWKDSSMGLPPERSVTLPFTRICRPAAWETTSVRRDAVAIEEQISGQSRERVRQALEGSGHVVEVHGQVQTACSSGEVRASR